MNIGALYRLTKPGVLYGNALTAAAGFFLAASGDVDWALFIATLVGTSLVIGSACVINNYLDQDIDSIMERTKSRPLISGEVTSTQAVIFGITLGLIGIIMLALLTNWLVVTIGIIGFVVYVWLYGNLSKRRSVHGTLVGSISGAMPILAGYVAVSGQVDIGAVLVFLVLFFWQMPEFYSISIFRRNEYKKAGVPVISVVKGVDHTKKQILIYTVAFVVSTVLLSAFDVAGYTYLVAMGLSGAYWIYLGFKGLHAKDVVAWSRKMFRFSLIMLLLFSFLISVDSLLP